MLSSLFSLPPSPPPALPPSLPSSPLPSRSAFCVLRLQRFPRCAPSPLPSRRFLRCLLPARSVHFRSRARQQTHGHSSMVPRSSIHVSGCSRLGRSPPFPLLPPFAHSSPHPLSCYMYNRTTKEPFSNSNTETSSSRARSQVASVYAHAGSCSSRAACVRAINESRSLLLWMGSA